MREGDTSALLSVEDQRRLAVLIDADNAQPSVIEGLLAEVAKFGVAGVKRIYGDWTSTKLGQWKLCLLEHSITPIQQFAYTSGKNATDSSLIIDAMDLMYSKNLDGFCLVSSDSDFTRLAQRLREAGMVVYGFGEHKTPDPFVQACDKFIYTEVLRAEVPEPATPAAAAKPAPKKAAKKQAATQVPAPAPEAQAPVVPHEDQYTGETAGAKRARIGQAIAAAGADAAVLTAPASLAGTERRIRSETMSHGA